MHGDKPLPDFPGVDASSELRYELDGGDDADKMMLRLDPPLSISLEFCGKRYKCAYRYTTHIDRALPVPAKKRITSRASDS